MRGVLRPTCGAHRRHLDVFTPPAGAWAAAQTQTATQSDSTGTPLSTVAISGSTIASAINLFAEPPDGWAGPATLTAQLTLPTGQAVSTWLPLTGFGLELGLVNRVEQLQTASGRR